MREHDLVVLTRAVPEHRLEEGDVGTIVYSYAASETVEVEFVRADGDTVAVVTLDVGSLRPFAGSEILHVRKLAS